MSEFLGKGSNSRVSCNYTEWELKHTLLYSKDVAEKLRCVEELVKRGVYSEEYLKEKREEWSC